MNGAKRFLQLSNDFSRAHHDGFLESTSLLNLGAVSLKEERFDEAIDWSSASLKKSNSIGAEDVALVAQGNLGWAYFMLGDFEKALAIFQEAEQHAAKLGDFYDQENELTNIGYIQMDQRRFDLAERSFQKALSLAGSIHAKEDTYNALRVLAKLSLRTGHVNEAWGYADQALQIARESKVHSDELYPMLVQGQVAARRGDTAKAQQTFEVIQQDKACPVFLKWEAQHSLAQLFEGENHADDADREYRSALTTFEGARATVQHEDFQLSFLTNAVHIYDDYVHFLISRGKTAEALRWADFSRARTLSEGLGLLSKERAQPSNKTVTPPQLNATSIARRGRGTLLFYWLGEKQSYLWAITATKIQLFPLPPAAEIEAAVQRYRDELKGPQDVLDPGASEGQALYHMLIEPVHSLIPKDGKAFIFPDGSLNGLNFETLVVSSPQPHFWIEDADVVNSSSLRVLDASLVSLSQPRPNLLLIGDSVSVGPDYPELPKAADQMASVSGHFPAALRRIYEREKATPAAYLQNDPEQFSIIHFVAHGTASRLSPLDSAIVLSKDPDDPNAFKLYARDIIHHRLKADLVTISACYGAGERQYSGEGLVGLAWAFLRAGSRNVIAALWDVADASTDQLMVRFYDELAKGAKPDAALRAAKLSLLRGNTFSSPFYWAPFQLYQG